MAELGMDGCEELIPQILARVKQAGYRNNGEVTDGEFSAIVGDCLACLRMQAGEKVTGQMRAAALLWRNRPLTEPPGCGLGKGQLGMQMTRPFSGGIARMRAGERTAGDANGAAAKIPLG